MDGAIPPDDQPLTRTEAEGATVDLPEGLGFFTTGQVLGERYEILEMLGRGGMGEVWRAFDLKLRVEVGLKALREELFQSERRLELLRQEVRAAREVVSPNVCRIFDLIEIDGRELVSMEYVDGATLLGVLQERGPLELKEAQDIASQFLAGLEAIHKAGLVHRDVKPENIMLTRADRVVVMDFGLAREPESGAGSVSGTPAYMAPEHAAGQDVDARADVYSAGVVLAEMVSPEGIKSYESRQSVWEGVRSEPAQVPDSPWAPVIKRAVARDRERRQNSAHTLIRELEDVTLRVEGAEDLHPYPGLASFTEDDAEYFFGREADVEAMWAKLEGPPRLLGLVGPSGAGKSSFLMAGLISNASTEWSVVRCTPGSAPFVALGQTLAATLAGDAEAMHLLPRVQEIDTAVELVALWSRRSSKAVLIVDQFEELFTLNDDEVQARFAELLARLPLEADVHVLLSLRDDFLMQCNRHEPLRPIVQGLTLLDPPAGANLRRALVQPATKCGYRFEDDDLVEEILAEVEGERGALPLVAFALARLWEKRDRDSGLLTRQAYHDIGGVGGALARHAEATVDRIGVERIPIVRELFRNLVTAEGTRAVREWNELLSVFEGTKRPSAPLRASGDPSTRSSDSLAQDDKRCEASEVLAELIDARLLTSYEVREGDEVPTRSVEIIHESLLANWPRLVRWQTQDADSARLRDELRQASRTWEEHKESRDYLWAGKAYREFASWRERYPGGLTEIEEAFGEAMTHHASLRKRRLQIAVAVVFVILLGVLAVIGGFWQRSLTEARRAALEAEAAKRVSEFLTDLFSISDPSEALGNTITAREILDNGSAKIEQDLKDQPELQARLMQTMGNAYIGLGLTKLAHPLLEKSLTIDRRHLGADHAGTLDSMNNMGLLLVHEGNFDEAAELFREAYEGSRRLDGPEAPVTLGAMEGLGTVSFYQGKFSEAETAFSEVLAVRRRILGSDHRLTLNALNNYASALYTLGKFAEAEGAYREALDIYRRTLGDEHPNTLSCEFNLVLAVHSQGRRSEALVLFQDLLTRQKRVLGDDHPYTLGTLSNIGELALYDGECDLAENMYREILEKQRNVMEKDNPRVADTLSRLAQSLLCSAQDSEADTLLREALAINQRVRPDHWLVPASQCLLAEALASQGRFEEAELLLIRGCAGVLQNTEADDATKEAARNRAAGVYEDWGKPDKAAEWRDRSY